jgi:diaminopimelate epimerase
MSNNKPLFLTKMQGAGNSFLIIDGSQSLDLSGSELAKKLCDFHFGLGADGLVVLHNMGQKNLKWDFFNSDGSPAEFCGNAARCIGLFAKQGWNADSINLETVAGVVTCEVKSENTVRVRMPEPKWIQKEIKTPYWGKPVAWINTGVPHLVVEVNSSKELKNFTKEAALMRSWEGLGKGGSNVTFAFFENDHSAQAVSFERGVEDYTLACGTGAVAAGIYGMEKFKNKECSIKMPGGTLKIISDNGTFMEGSAQRIADIKVSLENFK